MPVALRLLASSCVFQRVASVKPSFLNALGKGSSHEPNKSIHETPSSLLSDHIPAVLSPSPGDFPAKVSQQSEEIRKAPNFCEVPWASVPMPRRRRPLLSLLRIWRTTITIISYHRRCVNPISCIPVLPADSQCTARLSLVVVWHMKKSSQMKREESLT